MRVRAVGLRRFTLAATLAVLSLAAGAPLASASVTIGQLAPPAPPAFCNNATSNDVAQPTVTSGNPYVVPATITRGTVTSWSTNAATGSPPSYTMKIFRKVANPETYLAVGHSGPRVLTPGIANTFAASIPVKAGDFLGLNYNDGSAVASACLFSVPGESYQFRAGSLPDGQAGDFGSFPNARMNLSAVVEPANTFTPGSISRNKRKGTATLTVNNLPNPGELIGSGNGAKVAAAGARISKAVTAGTAQLLIKAKGKKKKKLNETGKVKLNVAVTYTPTSGDPSTQSVKVKLKKNL